jgi:hypothetical protein
MSVVAGCSLFDGIVMVADCRATIPTRSGEIHIDNLQKLFMLTPSCCVGFVGDIEVAGRLLKRLNDQAPLLRARDPRRLHPVAISDWLPRLFRHSYPRSGPQVAFLVGSVIPDRPNVVDRASAVALLERFRLGKLAAERNWGPSILFDIVRRSDPYVALGGTGKNLLYVLRSPSFIPESVRPLQYIAIGSGSGVVHDIDIQADLIFAGDVGNTFFEVEALRRAVDRLQERDNVSSVGGMLLGASVARASWALHGVTAEIPIGGEKIGLVADDQGRWEQRNFTTGKVRQLLAPWEVDYLTVSSSDTFDDLTLAEARMREQSRSARSDGVERFKRAEGSDASDTPDTGTRRR